MLKDKEKDKRGELTPEQEDFIRLLRQKAEDTPIPMAMEPQMMMSRLQPKKKHNWLKVVSPAALALTACFVMVLAGRSGNLFNSSLPAVDPSSTVESGSMPASEPIEPSSEQSVGGEPSAEFGESEGDPSSVPSVASGGKGESSAPDEVSTPAVSSKPDGSGSDPGSQAPSSEPSEENGSGNASVPESGEQTPPPDHGSHESDYPANDGIDTSYTPRNGGSGEDYSEAYSAIQSAATPENATAKYASGVLSAGISADGLQTNNEKAIITAGDGYFYVSRQSDNKITIVRGTGGQAGSLRVEFETPELSGLKAESTAITDCVVVNGRLFVAGTVTYSKNGKTVRTISALSCYDLEDPEKPVLLSTVAQDGTMVGLKAVDGYLYLFSRYYPDSTAPESYPEAYVPFRYLNGEPELVSAGDIEISSCSDESYIVATVFTSKDPGEVSSSLALQGGGKNFYLGEEGLYLFGERYVGGQVTTLISGLNYRKGQVTMAGEVTVPGILNRSDSPNEYGGTLRILTNSYGSTNDTNLFIFDRELNLLGSAERLVENQILRSVRFEKNKLFFTLYEDRNAIYALDLQIPQKMGAPYKAERSEEALQSVPLQGEQSLKLTGALGRSSLTLTLTGGDSDTSASIPLSGTYDENNIVLKVYDNGGYAALSYSDSGTQKQTVRLYAIEKGSLREVLQFDCSTWYGGFKCYLQNGKFYVVSAAETVVFDVESGKQSGTIRY